MNAAITSTPSLPSSQGVRLKQAWTILRAELSRNFITKRGFWIYGLAFAPATVVWLHSAITLKQGIRGAHDLAKDTQILAVLFQIFFLRPGVFFGCVGIFTYLFRGEFVERTLHYYFLAPVRREVLLVAKYVAGCVTAVSFFGVGFLLTFVGMYAHFPQFEVQQWMISGPGAEHLLTYLLITFLACLAWGSVFLWMGIRFRNPIIPSVVFLLWESSNVFFPAWLRRISVLHFLQSLSPVNLEARGGGGALLATTAEPETAVTAILFLVLIACGMLALSIYEIRRTEVNYSTD